MKPEMDPVARGRAFVAALTMRNVPGDKYAVVLAQKAMILNELRALLKIIGLAAWKTDPLVIATIKDLRYLSKTIREARRKDREHERRRAAWRDR